MELEKLSLKKLRELFSIAVHGEHYAIDGANYDRAEAYRNESYLLACELEKRKKIAWTKKVEKYKLQIEQLEATFGGTSRADRDKIEKIQTKVSEYEYALKTRFREN
jgi:hypothetical protein